MNTLHKGITTLLRSAITGEKCTLPEGFSLEEAYPQVKNHHMDTLLYEGALVCGISRKLPVMQLLFQRYCRAFFISEGQIQQLEKLFSAFEEKKIAYMPLKGSKMKYCYPKHELRTMGDADILIRMEQYEQIVPIMEKLGFSFKAESDHELVWWNSKLLVELHKRLIPSYNKDFYNYFGIGWQLAVKESGSRYTMRPEDEWIFMVTHFSKHFRDGGIGCRHVVDLWVYLRSHPNLDMEYVKKELKQLELLAFYENLCDVIRLWFEDGGETSATEAITEFIFASGSWGDISSRMLSWTVRDLKRPTATGGKRMYLLRLAFPGVVMLRGKYTILRKAPWLLPVVWIYRPFYKLLFERKDLRKRQAEVNGLSDEKIKTRQDFLDAVGLDYHF